MARRADFSTRGFQQSVDERYGVLNGIGIDEHAVVRDDPQETGNHHGRQNKRAVSLRAGVSGVAEPSSCNDMVFTGRVGMPRPVRSHPESPVRRIQKGPITGAVDAGSQATAAWRDRQRVHGPATRCCRTQAENQSLLDHGSQRSAFPSGLRTSLGEQLVTNVNRCLHHNHRTTHSTEVYAVSLQGGYSGTCPLIPTQTLLRGRAFAAAFGSD